MTMIADRYKHVAAVAATTLLPKRARVAARESLLARLHRSKARRADVLIVVHPKCGGTWLRVMLFRLYQQLYGLDSRRVFKTDELHRLNPDLPRFLVSNGRYSYEGVVGRAFEAPGEDLDLREKPLVFFARHPCDIVVSWHIQFARRTTGYKRELINHWLRAPVAHEEISLWDFANHEQMGVPGLIDYLNTWAENLQQSKQSLLVRYEDLRAEPHATLGGIGRFLGENPGDDVIDEAVRFASFENLRALEESKYFHNDGLRIRDPKDPDLFKVRRGKVGGYRDHFSPEQAEQLEDLVNSRLSPIFRYGTPGARAARATQGP